jgi:hypothetical protein
MFPLRRPYHFGCPDQKMTTVTPTIRAFERFQGDARLVLGRRARESAAISIMSSAIRFQGGQNPVVRCRVRDSWRLVR